MTSLKAYKVELSLKKKGFKQEPGDHKYFYYYYNGEVTDIRTKTSHCGQDIDDYLINKMSKQVSLNKTDFINLINCPLSKEKYAEKLRKKGIID